MLGATMVNTTSKPEEGKKRNRHTINLSDDVFSRLGMYVAKWGNTKEGIVNQSVYDTVFGRDQFLKMYAPHLTLEYSTPNTILINDSELNKTAVVKAKWNNIVKEKTRSLLSLKCELCDSDSCIHVRFSLVLPNILRIRKEDKLV
jgi:hypothetical protein